MDLILRPDRVAAGGDAIAREPSGRVVFVAGALPGESVRVRIVSAKRDFARGVVVEVLDPSPDRVVPPCPFVAGGCGGCSWQHVTTARQRALKTEIVADALRRIGRLAEPVVVAGPSLPDVGFRTTVRVAAGAGGRVGFRAAASTRVVPVTTCLVTHPRLAELLPGLRLHGVEELSLRVSTSTGERVAWWEGHGGRVGGLPPEVRTGRDAVIHQSIAGSDVRVSAGSFFQSSPAAAEALAVAVGEAVGAAAGPVVDAYGGVGLFALTALRGAERVTLLEHSPSSCADARVNLAGRDARVVEGAVESWTPEPAEVVVADPARAGMGDPAVRVLAATGCERFVLVSCDAAAGARDVRSLVAAGFEHRFSTVLDPFPHTAHVEVVTLLTRAGSGTAS